MRSLHKTPQMEHNRRHGWFTGEWPNERTIDFSLLVCFETSKKTTSFHLQVGLFRVTLANSGRIQIFPDELSTTLEPLLPMSVILWGQKRIYTEKF
jgi:hypothetical protein